MNVTLPMSSACGKTQILPKTIPVRISGRYGFYAKVYDLNNASDRFRLIEILALEAACGSTCQIEPLHSSK